MDFAAKLHKVMYGKSDRANAPENQNEEFQAGYFLGIKLVRETKMTEIIISEWERRGCPCEFLDGFQEWKRGLWAGRMQKTLARPAGDAP